MACNQNTGTNYYLHIICFFFPFLVIKHGRRKTLIGVSLPLSISWAFTLFAFSVEMIYTTAFVAGFCSAIIQVSLLSPLLMFGHFYIIIR